MTNVENTRSRGSYTRFTYVDRFQIWRYAGENGNKKALIHFKYKFPGLKKSTVRTFKKQHQKELKKVWSQERWPSKVIKAKKRGTPLLLGGLDKIIQTLLKNNKNKNSITYNVGPVLGPEVCSTAWVCQTCWDDRKSWNSCRSKKGGGTNIFAQDSL